MLQMKTERLTCTAPSCGHVAQLPWHSFNRQRQSLVSDPYLLLLTTGSRYLKYHQWKSVLEKPDLAYGI
jgi:hypothetical protein